MDKKYKRLNKNIQKETRKNGSNEMTVDKAVSKLTNKIKSFKNIKEEVGN